jgi:hypothetical protein
MVKNSHLQRNKGVVHDLVQKINMENIDPEITEEDDILIWKLMKSLKEKTAINERDNNEDKTWSSSVPQEKCDWSYEKTTLSKDKYLSRRLQTKEIGCVSIFSQEQSLSTSTVVNISSFPPVRHTLFLFLTSSIFCWKIFFTLNGSVLVIFKGLILSSLFSFEGLTINLLVKICHLYLIKEY